MPPSSDELKPEEFGERGRRYLTEHLDRQVSPGHYATLYDQLAAVARRRLAVH